MSERRRGRKLYRQNVPRGQEYTTRGITMTDGMWAALERLAERLGVTRSHIIRQLVQDALTKEDT